MEPINKAAVALRMLWYANETQISLSHNTASSWSFLGARLRSRMHLCCGPDGALL